MKNDTAAVSIPRHEFDHIGQLLETIRSQSELISQLTAERNERIRRNTLAAQRRAEVFRIPVRS